MCVCVCVCVCVRAHTCVCTCVALHHLTCFACVCARVRALPLPQHYQVLSLMMGKGAEGPISAERKAELKKEFNTLKDKVALSLKMKQQAVDEKAQQVEEYFCLSVSVSVSACLSLLPSPHPSLLPSLPFACTLFPPFPPLSPSSPSLSPCMSLALVEKAPQRKSTVRISG